MNNPAQTPFKVISTCFCLIFCLLAREAGAASIQAWDPTGTANSTGCFPGTWDASTTKNWTPAGTQTTVASASLVAWTSGNIALFCAGPGASASQGSCTVTVNGAITIGGIDNGKDNPGACNVTLANGTSGSLVLPSAATTINSAGTACGLTTINIPVTGVGPLSIFGCGTVTLGGANTYSGKTLLAGGAVSVGSLNRVSGGSASSNLGTPTTVANGTIGFGTGISGGILTYTGAGETTDRVIDLAGTTGGATIDNSGAGALVFTANLTATGAGTKTLTLQGSQTGANTISGIIVDNSLGVNKTAVTKAGTGGWVLSGNNSFTGGLTINGSGSISFGHNSAFGTGAITWSTAGFIQPADTAAYTIANAMTHLAATETYAGNAGGVTFSGAWTLPASGTLTLRNIASTITVSGVISGAASLTTSVTAGTGWIFSGVNTYSGNTTITSGALTIGGAGKLGNGTYAGTIANSGTFTYNSSAAQTLSGVISGAGPLTQAGAGTLTLSGANTYSGKTTISGGSLSVASLNKVTGGSANSNLGHPTTSANGTISIGAAAATGTLIYTGAGETTDRIIDLAGAAGGATIQNGGTGAISFSSDCTASGVGAKTLTLQGSYTGSANTIGGVIVDSSSGATSISKAGNSIWKLSAANTYSGSTIIIGGILQLGNDGGIPSGPGKGSVSLTSPGILDVAGFNCSVNGLGGSGGVDNSTGTGTLSVGNNNAISAGLTIGGVIQNTGGSLSLIKVGTGTLTLNAVNTYSGDTTLSAGAISLNGTSTLGNAAGTLHLSGGTLITSASRTASSAPVANPLDLTADSAVTTTSTATTVDLNFSSSTIGGSAGTLTLSNSATSGTGVFSPRFSGSGFNFSRPIAIANGGIAGTTKLQSFNTSGDQTFSGIISGNGSFNRGGSGGRTIFTQPNTYSGGTTVNAGTLLANNTTGSGTGSGSVTVGSGGTLGGTGTISGAVAVNSGGTLAPGASIGTLTLAVAPTLAGTMSMELNKAAGPILTSDKLVVSPGGGTLVYGGALSLAASGLALTNTDIFDLFDADTFSGSFVSVTPATPGTGLLWNTNQLPVDGTIKVMCNGTLAVTASANTNTCSGVGVLLGASGSAGSGIGYTYSWSPATGLSSTTGANPIASPTVTTTYTVTVTDSVGCTAQASVTVATDQAPAITEQPANTTVCGGTAASFSVSATGSGLAYSWAKHDNGGWGSAWSASGSGGTFRATSTGDNVGDPACTGLSSANDINSPSGNALGMYGGGGGDEVVTRTFAALASGQAVSIDCDNGNVDGGKKVGFSLQTSGGGDVLQFYFLGGQANYKYNDGSESDTGISFQRTGLRVQFVLTSASAYKLIVTACGASSSNVFTGTYSGTIAKLALFNQNTSGGGDYDIYFNSFLVGGYTDNADNYSGAWAGENKGDQPILTGNGGSTYTTPTLTIADSGTQYEVVVSGCGGSILSSAATVTVNATALVNAGPDQTVCSSSPAVTLGGWFGGAALSATWSGGAGSFNPDNTTLNAIYTPSAGEITAGTVTLTLTTDDPDAAGPCGPASDSMVITIDKVAATNVTFVRAAGSTLKISKTNLLAHASDSDSETITFAGVGTDGVNLLTTNGVTLTTDSKWIYYTNSLTPNAPDSFTYKVTDTRGCVGLGTVTVQVITNATGQGTTVVVNGSTATVGFAGIPGRTYEVQRSTNLTDWATLGSTSAPAAGVFQWVDDFNDLGVPPADPPTSAYYRLRVP